jgi:hypothetical protein
MASNTLAPPVTNAANEQTLEQARAQLLKVERILHSEEEFSRQISF